MSEKQSSSLEHESALDDTAKIPVLKPLDNRLSSHSSTPLPRSLPEEQQTGDHQDASSQLYVSHEIYEPELDDDLTPTGKTPARKESQCQPSEQQTLPAAEQKQPVKLSTHLPTPGAQSPNTPITIADDYDFSEIDVDIADIISYNLPQQNKGHFSQGPIAPAIKVPSPSSPVKCEAGISTTTSSETPLEEPISLTEIAASLLTEQEISASDNEAQLPLIEEIAIPDTIVHDKEESTTVESALYTAVEEETLEVDSRRQEHATEETPDANNRQQPEVPELPVGARFIAPSELSPIVDEVETPGIDGAQSPSVGARFTGPSQQHPTDMDVHHFEGAINRAPTEETPLPDIVDESPAAGEPVDEAIDTVADAAIEQVLPSTIADVSLPVSPEKYIETEQASGKEGNFQIVDEQLVALETPPLAKEPVGDSSNTSLPIETQADRADADSVTAEIVPVTPTHEKPPSKKRVAPVQPRRDISRRRGLVALILLGLLILISILLWNDLTATHVYLNALNPNNGKVLTQQDLGGYQDTITLTSPVYQASSLYVGIHSNKLQGTQQVLGLAGNTNAWSVTKQFAAQLAQGTLSQTSHNHLIAVSANGLQVMTADGHVLWQLQGEQPALGAHHYQPISDSQTLYTVASLKLSQVAAYDLQNGTQRWLQTLDDTLNDAPPFLLDDNTLYIASDHKLYALSSIDGSLRWEKVYPSRTLLMEREGQTHLLLAAGAQGLAALDPDTGVQAWSFDGQPGDMFTSAQFYQGTMANTGSTNGNVVYATGIVWQMPQVQEQVWLYAVNATTGTVRWSQQVGSGFASTDAGRTLLPLIDTPHRIVVLQQQLDKNQQRITAFDINTGIPRWSTLIPGITGSSPTLARTADGTLVLFTTVKNSKKVLLSPSFLRIFLIGILILTLIGLVFNALSWLQRGIAYLEQHGEQLLSVIRTFRSYTRSPFQRFTQLSPLARGAVSLLLLSVLLGAGTLEYKQLSQPRNVLYQVVALNGTIQWQKQVTPSTYGLATDAEGNIITANVGDHLYQLQALTHDGTLRWKTFSSQGIFSVPTISSPPGTLVVELRGDTPPTYQFAPADSAYPYTIDHLLVLYLLDRNTGTSLWQHVLVYPDEQQNAIILGADRNYIYIATTQAYPVPGSKGSTIELFAVNRATGTIDWRVFGPTEPNGPHDNGQLLLKEGQAIWQVAGTIYAIDTVVGQIEWRRQIIEDDPSILVQEDAMTQLAGTLLVTRRHSIHGLDLTTGNELWTLAGKGVNTAQSAGVSVVGQTILVYGNGQIEAFDAIDRRSLWRHKELNTIQHVSVSDDGKTAYLIEKSNVTGNSPGLVSLDVQTGTMQWTFEPARQTTFLYTSHDNFFSRNGILFVTVCFPSDHQFCTRERLYALTGATGKTAWTFTGRRISNLHLSQDGKTLLFSVNSSAWIDLLASLRD